MGLLMGRCKGVEQRIRKLEGDIIRLKTDYEQYFLGLAKMPPERLAAAVAREVRSLTATRITNTALRFRTQQAISKYNSYLQYWTRNLKDMEEGRTPSRRLTHGAAASNGASETSGRLEISTSGVERKRMDSFLRKLAAEYSKAGNGKAPDLEKLRQVVEQQNKVIREKYHVEVVSYRVVNEDGKVKLKAAPVKKETK